MLACVTIISLQSLDTGSSLNYNALYALGFGLLAPFMISISISISRYWTVNHNYQSFDFTIDTFLMISIAEIGFFVYFNGEINDGLGYSAEQIGFGVAASLF